MYQYYLKKSFGIEGYSTKKIYQIKLCTVYAVVLWLLMVINFNLWTYNTRDIELNVSAVT